MRVYNELRHFSTARHYRPIPLGVGDPCEPGYDDRYCPCEMCGGCGSVYSLRNIFTGAFQVVDGDTYWDAPCDEEDCDNNQSEWRQWDDLAECPECEGTGHVDTHYKNGKRDGLCESWYANGTPIDRTDYWEEAK